MPDKPSRAWFTFKIIFNTSVQETVQNCSHRARWNPDRIPVDVSLLAVERWLDFTREVVAVLENGGEQLIVQNYVEQRGVDLQPTVIVNKSQFSEPVHEEADPRAGGADHFRQHRLTDLGNYRLGLAFLAKMSEQQQDSGQPFFARIEKLIHQIFFITDVPL